MIGDTAYGNLEVREQLEQRQTKVLAPLHFTRAADATTYFLGAESLLVTRRPGMVRWREHLFALMSRNATNAADYFSLPPEATVTVGMRIEL